MNVLNALLVTILLMRGKIVAAKVIIGVLLTLLVRY